MRRATKDIGPASKAKEAAPRLSTKRLWDSSTLECPYVREDWPMFSSRTPFTLTIALGARTMWATFELGIYEGIMRFESIPERASQDQIWFKWRGQEEHGPLVNGDNNRG
ncbi:hypothetical protein B0T10DRAFT_566859 [Thelonectria olida]|uniref:Uncharacterized protein n=1 Tax=Thelonectria olida TaxID=1576542 RepID=A0A9P8VW24_9HYPO|nr:hypothetical protein B0T10DRAFT_566859 [Thelonectria olida]